MRILALDTATPATAVALLDTASGRVHVARDDPPAGSRPRHTTRVLPLAEEVIAAAELSPDALDRVAVGLGPGTFTGLRIGIATAFGLARAADASIVGVPTLTTLALGARGAARDEATRDAPLLALLDAGRGELFAAGWSSAGDPLTDPPAIEPTVLAPDALPDLVARLGAPLAVGDGAVRFAEVLRAAGAKVPPDDAPAHPHRVDAREHARLAARMGPTDPPDVRPLYLRRPDARPRH